AEDGIRDFHVTGVQTCALPIYDSAAAVRHAVGPRTGVHPDEHRLVAPIERGDLDESRFLNGCDGGARAYRDLELAGGSSHVCAGDRKSGVEGKRLVRDDSAMRI